MQKIIFLLTFFCSTVCLAQWNNDPNINAVICATSSHQLNHQMIPDESGGAFVTWIETQDQITAQINAQHISAAGNVLWPAAGITVSPVSQAITLPMIVSDGNGGSVISWLNNTNGTLTLYAQKISVTGEPQWLDGGLAVCPGARLYNFFYKIISDGNGGAIFIWDDNRGGISQVYGQRVSSVGSVLWQADGLPYSHTTVTASQFDAVTDTATGGFFLCWPMVTGIASGRDIFVQRVAEDGVALWGATGINICGAAKDQFSNKIISDGNGGVIVLWQDFRNDPVLSQIYGKRIGADGTLYWDEDGSMICDSIVPAITLFQVVSDGTGGGIVAWLDDFVQDQSTTSSLFAQRFNSIGNTLWPGNKIASWEDTRYISPFQMTKDNKQGSFITWNHASNPHPVGNEINNIYNVYAQHVFPNGLTQWPDSGTLVSSAPMNQYSPQIVCDVNSAAIIAWTDTRTGVNYDIYGARLAAADGPLPVEWLNFEAERNGNSHILRWEIAEEGNNKGFYIERSTDAAHFESIGFVASRDNSYIFIDSNPLQGNNFYRLKQVDIDGKFKYSRIIQLDIIWQEKILVYPNPVSAVLKVKITHPNAMLQILSSNGAVIKTKSIAVAGVTDVDISDLPKGVYYIKIQTGKDGSKLSGEFVKQ